MTRTLNRFQRISEKFINNENITPKELEFIEKSLILTLNELESEYSWLFDFKENISKDYILKLKS